MRNFKKEVENCIDSSDGAFYPVGINKDGDLFGYLDENYGMEVRRDMFVDGDVDAYSGLVRDKFWYNGTCECSVILSLLCDVVNDGDFAVASEPVAITHVSIDDLENHGYDVSGVTKETLEKVADIMCDYFGNDSYVYALEDACQKLGIPKN